MIIDSQKVVDLQKTIASQKKWRDAWTGMATGALKNGKAILPGTMLCLTVTLASRFLEDYVGSSALLIALLLGLAFSGLSRDANYLPGINFCAHKVLHFGVALLGSQIVFSKVQNVGPALFALLLLSIPATIVFSIVLGRLLGLTRASSLIAGSAVAICGASAALAVAAAMPRAKRDERHLLFVVVVITALSSTAMVLYPLLATSFGLDPTAAALFLGSSIHNVAQVAGAGYIISEPVGDLATFAKMLRVAMLVPIVASVAFFYRSDSGGRAKFPLYLLGFLLLMIGANYALIPARLRAGLSDLSHGCLLLAIAGLGSKTLLGEMFGLGWRPLFQLVVNTIFLAGLVLALVYGGRMMLT